MSDEIDPKLVWARMKFQMPWPALVVEAPWYFLNKVRKGNSVCVFFFGTHNFAWVKEIRLFIPEDCAWQKWYKRKGLDDAVTELLRYQTDKRTNRFIKALVHYSIEDAKVKAKMEGYDIVTSPYPYFKNLKPRRNMYRLQYLQ